MSGILVLVILIVGLAPFIGLVIVLWGYQWKIIRRVLELGEAAPQIIDTWAKENDYQIRIAELKTPYPHSWFQRGYPRSIKRYAGPYIGRVSSGHYVYRVVVTRIGEEKRRAAWIRLGRDVWGNTPEDFKVIWEDEWRPSEPPVDF